MMTMMYGFNGPGFCDVGLVLGGSRGKSVSLSFPASRDHLHPLTSGTLPGRMESLSSFSSLSFHPYKFSHFSVRLFVFFLN